MKTAEAAKILGAETQQEPYKNVRATSLRHQGGGCEVIGVISLCNSQKKSQIGPPPSLLQGQKSLQKFAPIESYDD